MRRYSTANLTAIWSNVDLTGCQVYVTVAQPSRAVFLTISGDDVSVTDIAPDGSESTAYLIQVELTQAQTAMFKTGEAEMQVNAIGPQGHRFTSDITKIPVTKNLLQNEVEYIEQGEE